jgi:hypothetical protein
MTLSPFVGDVIGFGRALVGHWTEMLSTVSAGCLCAHAVGIESSFSYAVVNSNFAKRESGKPIKDDKRNYATRCAGAYRGCTVSEDLVLGLKQLLCDNEPQTTERLKNYTSRIIAMSVCLSMHARKPDHPLRFFVIPNSLSGRHLLWGNRYILKAVTLRFNYLYSSGPAKSLTQLETR